MTYYLDYSLGARKREAEGVCRALGWSKKYVLAQGVRYAVVGAVSSLGERAREVGAALVTLEDISRLRQRKEGEKEGGEAAAAMHEEGSSEEEEEKGEGDGGGEETRDAQATRSVTTATAAVAMHEEGSSAESPRGPPESWETASVVLVGEEALVVQCNAPDVPVVDYGTGVVELVPEVEEVSVFEQVFGVPREEVDTITSWADHVRDWAAVDEERAREARKLERRERKARKRRVAAQKRAITAERRTRVKRTVQQQKEAGAAERRARAEAAELERKAALLVKRKQEHLKRRERRKAARAEEKKKRKQEERRKYYEEHQEEWAEQVALFERNAAIKLERQMQRDACKVFVGGVELGDLLEAKGVPREERQRRVEMRKTLFLDALRAFGEVRQVLTFWEAHHVFVVYREPAVAARAMQALTELPQKKAFCAAMAAASPVEGVALRTFQFYARWPKSSPNVNKTPAMVLAQSTPPPPTQSKQPVDITRVECYRCGTQGHYAYACPRRKR